MSDQSDIPNKIADDPSVKEEVVDPPVEKQDAQNAVADASSVPTVPTDPTVRHVGTVKWFNVKKGFGFIVADDQQCTVDVFVHQSSLLMDGFRSLEEGERVSFVMKERVDEKGNPGKEAVQISAEDPNVPLKGSSIRPLGRKRDQIRCFKCGKYSSHIASKCKHVAGNAKVCYCCQSTDHLISHCPNRASKSKGSGHGPSTSSEASAQPAASTATDTVIEEAGAGASKELASGDA